MIRKYCDRCGIECNVLHTIKIPADKREHAFVECIEVDVCEKCREHNNKLLKMVSDFRRLLYENFYNVKSEETDGNS
jgi:hypothetical protein